MATNPETTISNGSCSQTTPRLVRQMPARRLANASVRGREYLTPDEVESLQRAASRTGRHGHRCVTLILIANRHGLRVSELVALR
jgi:integrase